MVSNIYAILVMMPCIYCAHYFIHLIVPIDRPILFSILAMVINSILWSMNHILFTHFFVAFDLLIFAADLILIICFVPHKKRSMFLLIYILLCVVELIISVLVLSAFSAFLHISLVQIMSPTSMTYPTACLITSTSAIPIMYYTILLLRKILPPLHENRILITFFFFFFSHVLFAYFFINLYIFGKSLIGCRLSLVIIAVLYISVCIVFLRGYQYMYKIDLEAKHTRQIQQQLELQAAYYHQLQNNIVQINKIRHDLSNQLQAAYYLLEQGEHEQVRKQLDLLEHQIHDKVGTKYCPNMIVDAVLTEKARRCNEQDIPLCLSVFLPEDLPIETAHLCSIFSNILDNSIQATLKTSKPYGTIELSADVHSSFVMIECSNPSLPFRQSKQVNPMRMHGLGLEILDNIASSYHGSMDTYWKDGRFILKIALELSDIPCPSEST